MLDGAMNGRRGVAKSFRSGLLGLSVAVIASAVIGLSVGAGFGLQAGLALVATLGFATAFALPRWPGEAVLTLILIGVSVDGLPGPSIPSLHVVAPTILAIWLIVGNRHRLGKLPLWVRSAAAALGCWWLVCAYRGLLLGERTWDVYKWAGDFLFFPLLVLGSAAAFQDRSVRFRVSFALALLAVWVSVVNVAGALGILPSDSVFAHAYRTVPVGGLWRLYTQSSDLITPVALMAFAALLYGQGGVKKFGGVAFIFGVVATLLELGRVKYAGFALALVAIALWHPTIGVARRVVLVALFVGFLGFAVSSVGPFSGAVGDVSARITSIVDHGSSYDQNDTLEYRDVYKRQIRANLSPSEWGIGFGFRPTMVFMPDANRQTRNSDLGWYNALLTMGLIGVVLLYVFPVGIGFALWFRRASVVPTDRWVAAGAFGVAVYCVAVSSTLVVLASFSGLAVVAIVFGMGVAVLASPRRLDYGSPLGGGHV